MIEMSRSLASFGILYVYGKGFEKIELSKSELEDM
jgi:hypothetical protein